MKKSNKYRTVMNCSFRVLSKVFITIVNEIIYNKSNKTIKKHKILCSSLIEKLKASFSEYINYKNEIDSNKNELNIECIDNLLNLTFDDFLRSAGFPFKDENCSIKLHDLIIKILNDILNDNDKYELDIINTLKQKNIFLDELKGNKKTKSKEKEPNNNYYNIFFNRGDNKLFIKFLEQKCSEIINFITSENYQQTIDKFLNKKRIFHIIKISKNSNIKKEDNVQNPLNVDNIDVFNETNFNEKIEQHNIYSQNEQKEKICNYTTNFTTMNKEITKKDELPRQDNENIIVKKDHYIVYGRKIDKNFKTNFKQFINEFVFNKSKF